MLKYLKQLFGESVIYGVSGIITSFIGMFLIPLYTKVFDPADYGIIALLATTSLLASMFIIFGMDNATAVWYWDKTETSERKKTISVWYFFLSATSLLVAFSMIIFRDFFSLLILSSSKHQILIALLGINLLFSGFQKIANIWFRIRRQPWHAVGYSLLISLITIGLNIFFILFLKVGLRGIFYSQVLASLIGFLVTTIMLREWISFSSLDLKWLKKMLKFSLPLLPAIMVFWLMNSASTYFLNFYVHDKAEIGLYQIATTISSILGLGVWALLQAWPPFALSIQREQHATAFYSLVFELYCVIGFLAAFTLMLFAKDILLTFTNVSYIGAKDVLGLLSINVILLGIPGIIAIANNIVKKNGPYAVAVSIGSVLTVLLFVLLIPMYGKTGAAVSMILGNFLVVVVLAYRAQQLYYIPYNFKRIFAVILFELVFVKFLQLTQSFLLNVTGLFVLSIILFLLYKKIYKIAINGSILKTVAERV